MQKSVVDTIRSARPLPPFYELTIRELDELHNIAKSTPGADGLYNAIVAAYLYGFIRGRRAEQRAAKAHKRSV